ncbi:hypothetical protein CC2G_002092 [Coprinopsis cinerea AmutBmut pab1-1]|nr:hypothetical protein CC2G_002092 [Coprinopsis cinerea AmutBmut pab1-1]
MAMAPTLLSLPVEILTKILSLLPCPSSLLSTTLVCKRFHELYTSSSYLQYLVQLSLSGMQDNPYCSHNQVSLKERLDMLREREERWRTLEPRWSMTIPIEVPGLKEGGKRTSGVYDVTPSWYFLGVAQGRWGLSSMTTVGVQSLKMPTSPEETVQRKEIPFTADNQGEIVDFGTSIEEHDLVAVVAMKPLDDPRLPGLNFLSVHLLHHSTGQPHSRARMPVLPICTVGQSVNISVEICGENLLLSVLSEAGEASEETGVLFRAYDWIRGVAKGWHRQAWNLGLIFLREDIFLIPSARHNRLEIYYLPPSSYSSLPPDSHSIRGVPFNHWLYSVPADITLSPIPIHHLALPALAAHWRQTTSQCRCEPSPIGLKSSTSRYVEGNRPFTNDPDRAIAVFSVDFHGPEGPTPLMMFVHRKTLLDLLPLDWTKWVEENMKRNARRGVGEDALLQMVTRWREEGVEYQGNRRPEPAPPPSSSMSSTAAADSTTHDEPSAASPPDSNAASPSSSRSSLSSTSSTELPLPRPFTSPPPSELPFPLSWSTSLSSLSPPTTPYATWSPHNVLWLNARDFASVFITSTAGARFVSFPIENVLAAGGKAQVRVLDFDEYRVRREVERRKARKKERDAGGLKEVDGKEDWMPERAVIGREWREEGLVPPSQRRRTRDIGVGTSANGEEQDGNENANANGHADDEISVIDIDIDDSETDETFIPGHRFFPCFSEDVHSNPLPHVEYLSKAEYDWDAVLVDEQRIIGMRHDRDPGSVNVDSIEVLYFG